MIPDEDETTNDGSVSAPDSDNTITPSSPPQRLPQSQLDLLLSYPIEYINDVLKIDTLKIENHIENLVMGDNVGVVGRKGRFRAGTITKTTGHAEHPTSLAEGSSVDDFSGFADYSDLTSFEEWFFETDLDSKIHVLLVAVFAGNSLKFVNSMRRVLKGKLTSPDGETQESDAPTRPRAPRRKVSTILDHTRTVKSEAEYTVESGLASETTIEFSDPDAQKIVLEFLSSSDDLDEIEEIDDSKLFRPELLNLLIQICKMDQIDIRSMGASRAELTRSQAAIGIGELAEEDYGNYLSLIIRPWARSQDSFLRFIVGWILFALAAKDNYRSSVFSLLTHWAKSSNEYLKWTAAAACSRIGLIDIDETLKIIKPLLETDSPYILYALRVSIGLLYLSARNAYKIIEGFADWLQTTSRDNRKSQNLINNVPPLFLSLVQGKFADDLEPTDDEIDDGFQIIKIGVWDLIGRETVQGSNLLSSCVATLIKQGFTHERASVVDWTCDVVEQWITEADNQRNNAVAADAVLEVLLALKTERIASRYIRRIVTSRNFADSVIASQIKKAYS